VLAVAVAVMVVLAVAVDQSTLLVLFHFPLIDN
jgi:hypothetical protein